MSKVIGSPDQVVQSTRAAAGAADFAKISRDFGSAVDVPVAAFWPENARAWFEMSGAVIVGKAFGGRIDRDSLPATYRANEAAVRAPAR